MLKTCKQIITRQTLPNTSRSKGNQKMILDQLIECKVRKPSSKNHAENEARRPVSVVSDQQISFNIFLFS